jgi:hypothetical protein
VRNVLLIVGLLAALAVPAGAAAAKPPPPNILCGSIDCQGSGGGWTGCTQQTASSGASIPILASIRHYLVVSYCKRYGIITSVSIAAHGCDASGFGACSVGPAWQTGGGVGAGSASFEAHAQWSLTVVPLYNNTDIIRLAIPYG